MKVTPPAYLKQRMNTFGAELMGHCKVQKRIFSEFNHCASEIEEISQLFGTDDKILKNIVKFRKLDLSDLRDEIVSVDSQLVKFRKYSQSSSKERDVELQKFFKTRVSKLQRRHDFLKAKEIRLQNIINYLESSIDAFNDLNKFLSESSSCETDKDSDEEDHDETNSDDSDSDGDVASDTSTLKYSPLIGQSSEPMSARFISP